MLEDLLPRRANPERSGDAKQRVLTSPGPPRCRRIETIVPGAGRGSFRRKEGFPWPRANSPPPAPCRRSATSARPSPCQQVFLPACCPRPRRFHSAGDGFEPLEQRERRWCARGGGRHVNSVEPCSERGKQTLTQGKKGKRRNGK